MLFCTHFLKVLLSASQCLDGVFSTNKGTMSRCVCYWSAYIRYPEKVEESLDIAESSFSRSHTWSFSVRCNITVLLATPNPERWSPCIGTRGSLFSIIITNASFSSWLSMWALKRYVPLILHTKCDVSSSKAPPSFRNTLSKSIVVSWCTGPNLDFLVTKKATFGVGMHFSPKIYESSVSLIVFHEAGTSVLENIILTLLFNVFIDEKRRENFSIKKSALRKYLNCWLFQSFLY